MKPGFAIRLVLSACALFASHAACAEDVPGVVINYIPASSKTYVGSPGIAVLPDGHYIAKHDEFGPGSTEHEEAITQVFASPDRGTKNVIAVTFWWRRPRRTIDRPGFAVAPFPG